MNFTKILIFYLPTSLSQVRLEAQCLCKDKDFALSTGLITIIMLIDVI